MNGRLSLALAVIVLGSAATASWGQGFYPPRRAPWGSDLPPEVRPYFAPPGPIGDRALRESYGIHPRYQSGGGQPMVFNTRTQANSGGFVPDHGRVSRKQIIAAAATGGSRYRASSSISNIRNENNIRRYSSR